MLAPDEWEVIWRLDYLDPSDGTNRNLQTFGLNHYIDGHDLKWQFSVTVDETEGPDTYFAGVSLFASF